MNEDELRAAFARHEAEAPQVDQLHTTINTEAARRRRRRGTMLAGTVAAGVALAIGLPLYLAGPAKPVSENTAASPSAAGRPKDLNLLLLGSDHRGSWAEGNARADTIVIVHIPADRGKIFLISVNRDERVKIPGHGVDKINTAFYYGVQQNGPEGGLALVEKTVSQLSGIAFDGGVVVDYPALRSVTDKLGGVPVCLPAAVPIYDQYGAKPTKSLPAGCRTLGGADALALVRQRYGLVNGGYDRDRNAQRYLIGLARKAAELQLPQDAGTILSLTRTSGLTVRLDGISAPDLARQLQNRPIIALSLANTFHSDGGAETIPPEGLALLKAVQEADLDRFVAAHPNLVLPQ